MNLKRNLSIEHEVQKMQYVYIYNSNFINIVWTLPFTNTTEKSMPSKTLTSLILGWKLKYCREHKGNLIVQVHYNTKPEYIM